MPRPSRQSAFAPVRIGKSMTVNMLPFLLVACSGGGGEPAPAASVRDSAGVSIVENPAEGSGAGWVVADTPSVDIGGGEGGTQYEFSRVVGAVRLVDGRLAVANVGTSEVRFYDAAGTFVSASGRSGSGPGEFQAMAGLWRGPDDSLLVSDLRAQRLTVLDGSGSLGRVFSLGGRSGLTIGEGGGVSFALPQGWFRDRSVLGMEMPIRVNQPREVAYRDTVTLLRFDAAGAVSDTIGRYPGIEMEQATLTFGGQSFPAPSPVPMGRNTIAAVSGDLVVIATNDAWELELRAADGALARVVRVAVGPVPLTEQDIATHREEQLELMETLPELRGVPPPIREQMLARVKSAKYPATMPFIAGILPGQEGQLWVQEVTRPGEKRARFAVLDSTGALLGRVLMPASFQALSIGAGEVVGVWRDDDDVEHVRAYPLRR